MDLFFQGPKSIGVISRMRIKGDAALAAIQIYGGTIDGANELSDGSEGLIIVTGYNYNQQTNQQIVQSLGEQFFLYTFGDRMGSITINGYVFNGICNNSTPSTTFEVSTKKTGIVQILEFYGKNKVNKINPSTGSFPIIRTKIDGQEIDGVLVGCTVNVNDPTTYLGSFSMSLITIPSV